VVDVRIKRSTSFTLDEEHIEQLKEMAEVLNITASELLDAIVEFYYYNNFASQVRSAHDEGILKKGENRGISS
jgi:predicted DNA-binding ribbon-helix-helix protein